MKIELYGTEREFNVFLKYLQGKNLNIEKIGRYQYFEFRIDEDSFPIIELAEFYKKHGE